MTLRQLIEKVGDEYMDAELSINIIGKNGASAYTCQFTDWPSRRPADPRTGEPAYMTLSGFDHSKRILKVKE